MRSSNHKNILIAIGILAMSSIFCSRLSGTEDSLTSFEPVSAVLNEITGTVQTLNPSEGLFINAFDGQGIDINYQVLTHNDGRVKLILSNGTIVRLSPLTTFILEELEGRETGAFARLKLEVGEIWIILNGGEVEVDSPSGLASVRGSYLQVVVDRETKETKVTCLEGECSLGNDAGTINLVAGQTGIVKNRNSVPKPGTMSNEDVSLWLTTNPEATQVLMPLTETVSASGDVSSSEDSPTSTATLIPFATATLAPAGSNSTGIPSATFTASATGTQNSNLTPTSTSVFCGPPADWILYTVVEGDAMESIASAYLTTPSDIRHANCLGDSNTIFVGMSLFVPNVVTITPTPSSQGTNTATVTPTLITSTVTATSSTGANATATATTSTAATPTFTSTTIPAATPTFTASTTQTATTLPTATATDSPSEVLSVSGPADGAQILDSGACVNIYIIDVSDADGLSFVKVEYSTVPDFVPSAYEIMSLNVDKLYQVNLSIDTSSTPGQWDDIFWRFWIIDSNSVSTYYPDLTVGPYSFTDTVDCTYSVTLP